MLSPFLSLPSSSLSVPSDRRNLPEDPPWWSLRRSPDPRKHPTLLCCRIGYLLCCRVHCCRGESEEGKVLVDPFCVSPASQTPRRSQLNTTDYSSTEITLARSLSSNSDLVPDRLFFHPAHNMTTDDDDYFFSIHRKEEVRTR